MKHVLLILCVLSLAGKSQDWVPDEVNIIMYKKASINKRIDTVLLDNYRYVYKVVGDSSFIDWQLIKAEKLYFSWNHTACAADFGITWAEFLFLPSVMKKDKVLHWYAGEVIATASELAFYKLTKKKWLSFGLATLTASLIGGIKELTDPMRGGTKSLPDWSATTGGGLRGALRIRIYLNQPINGRNNN